MLRRRRHPTPTGGPPAVIAAMVTAARELDPERTAVGIGIAAPGPLDPAAGMVIRMPNLPGWHDVPLAALVAEARSYRRGCTTTPAWRPWASPCGRRSGSKPAGLPDGEHRHRRWHRHRRPALRGRHGLAGELGHILLDPAGPTCGLGHAGCLEALASGSALARRAREAMAAGAIPADSVLLALATDRPPAASMLAAAALQGDTWALAAWQDAGQALGRGLASIINTLDPERIVLGGGLTAAWDLWAGAMHEALAENAVTWPDRACDIVPADLGDDGGLVGAALWVADGRA
ncbi:MAG: ROK family protein [Ardenticatenia bacterium]|nr:ROK family protein [Ardenticatenia bacterium]